LIHIKETIANDSGVVYPTSCLTKDNINHTSLIVQVPGHNAFPVVCDSNLAGLGWLVIQRRRNGLVNFYRDWSDYRAGFGDPNGDFFIGLEKLNWLTAYQPFELYIHLEERGYYKNVFAKYDEFLIGNESEDLFTVRVKKSLSDFGEPGVMLTCGRSQQWCDLLLGIIL